MFHKQTTKQRKQSYHLTARAAQGTSRTWRPAAARADCPWQGAETRDWSVGRSVGRSVGDLQAAQKITQPRSFAARPIRWTEEKSLRHTIATLEGAIVVVIDLVVVAVVEGVEVVTSFDTYFRHSFVPCRSSFACPKRTVPGPPSF